jgi:hypothetical protein
MPYSRDAQLFANGLDKVVAGDGQPLEVEDAGKIRKALPSVLADFSVRGIVTVVEGPDVPDEVFNHLSVMVASEIADKFGLSSDEITILASRAQGADGKLRNQRAKTVPSSVLRMSCI